MRNSSSSVWQLNLLFGSNKCEWWICCVSVRRLKANVCERPCSCARSCLLLGPWPMSAPSVPSTVGCRWAAVTQTPAAGRCRPSSRWLMELWKQTTAKLLSYSLEEQWMIEHAATSHDGPDWADEIEDLSFDSWIVPKASDSLINTPTNCRGRRQGHTDGGQQEVTVFKMEF